MKPRTKLQFRVAGLSDRIPKITNQQKQYAFNNYLEHRGFATKSKVLCLDCGESFPINLISKNKATCPNCNTRITVKKSRCTTDEQNNYFAITTIVEDFQVVRNFEIKAKYKKGRKADLFLHEILQYWILPNGKNTLFGKSHRLSWCMDSWGGGMEIRQESKGFYGDRYDIYARFYHPDSVFKTEYLKYGINHNLRGFSFLEAINNLPNYPRFETLLKAKKTNFLNMDYRHKIDMFWSSLKIMIKNEYKVNDASMYFDYLDLLRYFRKDLHNSKYVCPKNLKKAHDYLMKKKREIIRQQELQRERERIIERKQNLERAVMEYVQRNQKFFDLEFKEKEISITVLQSVQDFLEEGDELNHCVYTNEYYSKEDSLILSARVNGVRTETIEIKLPSLKIEQSRGYGNKPSKYNKKILVLVRKNLEKIREIVIKTRPKSKLKSAA